MSQYGPEILPGTSEYRWVQLVVAAVEKTTGRPTRWNGRLFFEAEPNTRRPRPSLPPERPSDSPDREVSTARTG